jgi:PKD repeat protein
LALEGFTVIHAFEEPGTFQVDLDAWDAAGNHAAAVDSAVITVEDIVSPIPYGGGDRTVGVLDPFTLDASGTTDNDPTILETGTFVWEFQDGAVRVSLPGPMANYTFARAGSYTVRLTVRDAGGNAAAVTFKVTAADIDPPTIVANVPPAEVLAGDSLQLNASGTHDNVGVASVNWRVQGPFSFDTQIYTSQGTVLLKLIGNYTVTVTAKDAVGNAASLSWGVRVVQRPAGGPVPINNTTQDPVNETPGPNPDPTPGPVTPGPQAPAFGTPALIAAMAAVAIALLGWRRRRSR